VERSSNIQSVERAIDLLAAMNMRPFSTLHDLHRDTGLPKPSIVRLLRTLEAKGLVKQSSGYGAYRLLSKVKSLASGFHHDPETIEAAEQIMIDFTRREKWALALSTYDVDAMVVRASTIPYTTLSLMRSSIGTRWSMVSGSHGRAYLAFTPSDQRKTILEIVKKTGREEDAIAHDEDAFAKVIEEVRNAGYALRDLAIQQRTMTIAVPVFSNDCVVASLGLTWILTAMPMEKALERYVPCMRETAAAISRELSNASLRADNNNIKEATDAVA
jgi:IclR family mhp operon transcriptional activator